MFWLWSTEVMRPLWIPEMSDICLFHVTIMDRQFDLWIINLLQINQHDIIA